MSDASLRLAITFGLLTLFVALEHVRPARLGHLTLRRFGTQAAMAAISAVLARLALGGGLAGVALIAESAGVGLFNIISVPVWVAIIISLLVLDLAIWGQHLAMHKVPLLWRLHRVHHGDTIMDVSTALRFHPFEILASLAFKAALILLLGAPALAVLSFEIALGAGALFTHANIALPSALDRCLRAVLITPSLHVIHHSPNSVETNSNYGFSLSIWDQIFGTFRDARLDPHGPIGLENWREPNDQSLPSMLANPFR